MSAFTLTQRAKIVTEALDRLTSSWRGKRVVEGLVSANALPWQTYEDDLFDVLNGFLLGNAIGAQLDVLGELVGEPRQGRSDTVYRLAVRVRIAVNRSRGTSEDVLKVFGLLGFPFSYEEFFPARIRVTVLAGVGAAAPTIKTILQQTKAAGVATELVSAPSTTVFVFAPTGATAQSAAGFGDVLNPAIGGGMIGLL